MSILDILILLVIAGLVVLAWRTARKKDGCFGSGGCCGDCGSCGRSCRQREENSRKKNQ